MNLHYWIDFSVGLIIIGVIIYFQIKGYIVINKDELEKKKERTHREVELKYESSINAFKQDVSALTEKNQNLEMGIVETTRDLERVQHRTGTVRLKVRKELFTLIEKSNETGFISRMGTKQRVRKHFTSSLEKIIDELC